MKFLNANYFLVLAFIVPLFAQSSELPKFSGLAKVRDHGGLCPYGGCYTEISIDPKGNYEWSNGFGVKRQGRITENDLKTLSNAMKSADFQRIKSNKFEGDCPTAYDGSERIYTFNVSNRIEQLPSCTYAIDSDLSLFKTTDEIVAKIYRLGPNQALHPTPPR
jgi:hypothetical protein